MQYKLFITNPPFETNTWLLWDEPSHEAMLVDPAKPSQEVAGFVKDNNLVVRWIVNTHGHFDHIGGNEWAVQTFSAPLCIQAADADMITSSRRNFSHMVGEPFASPPADRLLADGDELPLGDETFRVIHTPGHSPGSISLLSGNILVSGDTLFDHGIGRTDLPGGSTPSILKSIRERLLTLPGHTVVLPGHGSATTIEDEEVGNPYVGMMV